MNMQFNNQNQSSCDCSGNQGNQANNGMFNMNMGNPQHQLNMNNNHMSGQSNMSNNMPGGNNMNMAGQVDLSTAMGLPSNTLETPSNNVAKKDLIDSLNKLGVNTNNTMEGAVKDSYYILLKNINLAFILVAAFAWNDAVKYYIAKLIRNQHGSPYYYLYYALIVTLLAVLSVRLTRKFLIGN